MRKLSLALSLTALLSAPPMLVAEEAEAPAQDANTLIATVNEKPYQLDIFRAFYNERLTQSRSQNTPEFQEQVFNEFLNLIVAAQEAEKRDLGDNREVKAAIELQRLMVLSSAVLQQIGAEAEITDAELEEAYEQFKERAKRTEYKAPISWSTTRRRPRRSSSSSTRPTARASKTWPRRIPSARPPRRAAISAGSTRGRW